MRPAVKCDPWVVFDYEAEMFFGMCELLENRNPKYAALPPLVRNAVVESALLHARQLVDILLSRSGDPDDINLSSLLPGFEPPRLHELRSLYGKRLVVGSPCWTLNKYLAHPTMHRGNSFDYSAMLTQLAPLIADIVRQVEERRAVTPI